MKGAVLFFSLLALSVMRGTPALPSKTAGRNAVIIRGQIQDVYYYPAKSPVVSPNPVLFLGGDAGFRGFAVDLAQSMSQWGPKTNTFPWKQAGHSLPPPGNPRSSPQ